ncbi:ankyrin repeat domain-containing protein [archaeon]|nr:MAG: ankyrin repeat domain-containing protein [archaeon]
MKPETRLVYYTYGISSPNYTQSLIIKFGNTLLMVATFWNRRILVRFLLQEGSIDVNAVNTAGRTALMVACETDLRPIVEMLVEAGADVNHCDNVSNVGYDACTL